MEHVVLNDETIDRLRDGETIDIVSSDLGPDGHNGRVRIEFGDERDLPGLSGFVPDTQL